MAAETQKEIQLEIAHVLFIDTVGYSKLSINEQRAVVDELTQIVRSTEQFQKADASERLIKISTGDGMALVFYASPEGPVRCAMELSRAVKDHPRLRLRMGIHSGPVSGVVDVTGRTNLAGAGLNLAQRVMHCGDPGHILVSKHVAEDLEEYDEWRPLLHELGECEVKHGVRISVANLYTEELGNPAVPEKLKAARAAAAAKRKRTAFRWVSVGVLALLAGIAAIGVLFFRYAPRLADTRTDKHLWGQTYDRDLADVFAIQSEIAEKIADQLEAKISPREKAAIEEQPTKDLAAYDLYVRATALIDKAAYEGDRKDYFQAVDLLNQAVARDPGFLLAYCRLAEAHDELYFTSGRDRPDLPAVDRKANRLALAKAAIDSAFRLKPDSGEAHLALATHLYHGYFDYDRAHDELAIAVRTLPNNARIFEWSGLVDRRQGRWHDAVRNFERAIELDPRNVNILTSAAVTYDVMRDYGQARETSDRLITLEPNNIHARILRARIDFDERADTRPLHAVSEKILRDDPASAGNLVGWRFYLALYERDFASADRALAPLTENKYTTFRVRTDEMYFSRAYAEGLLARIKGDAAAARAAFTAARAQQEEAVRARPDDGPTFCLLGLIDAGLGRKEEALREGRRALELTPVVKNAVDGPEVLYFFAVICACTGERDLAIEQLETLAKMPVGVSYGELRLDPDWDPLRGDPRFEKIVVSLAPKEMVNR